MDTLQLPRALVNQIMTQAQHSPDAEICGLIAGTAGIASHCYPVVNRASDAEKRYQMEPSGQINAMRQMREAGQSLIAIYHSHPHAPAKPSITDINEAEYPEAAYLIVSLDTTGVIEMAAFRIGVQGEVVGVELEVV